MPLAYTITKVGDLAKQYRKDMNEQRATEILTAARLIPGPRDTAEEVIGALIAAIDWDDENGSSLSDEVTPSTQSEGNADAEPGPSTD